MAKEIIFFLVWVAAGTRHVPDFVYQGTVWPEPQLFRQELSYSVLSQDLTIEYAPDSKQCELLQDTFNRYGQLIRSLIGRNSLDKKLRFSKPEMITEIGIMVINCESEFKMRIGIVFSILIQYFHLLFFVHQNFRLFTKIFDFSPKIQFFTKISIYHENFDF